LRVEDDGQGFDAKLIDAPNQRGIGLRNMRERIEDLGGEFSLESRPGRTELAFFLKAAS
jgi:two-component system NarL family sensor kinase